MYKCIDRVVGEIIESENEEVFFDVCNERKFDYGDNADFYQLEDGSWEIKYIK